MSQAFIEQEFHVDGSRIRVQVDSGGCVFVTGAKEVRAFFPYSVSSACGGSLHFQGYNPAAEPHDQKPYLWVKIEQKLGGQGLDIELRDQQIREPHHVLPYSDPPKLSAHLASGSCVKDVKRPHETHFVVTTYCDAGEKGHNHQLFATPLQNLADFPLGSGF